ncbi:hypothetical protein Bbelb_004040 [Branchiostoma belcheri]|nr:hypothetical protein Bbelb_004040 [Branchiostoma belcheri]
MEGKNELGKNSAQEDAPRPLWCTKQKCSEADSIQRGHDSTVCVEDDLDKVIDLEGGETDDFRVGRGALSGVPVLFQKDADPETGLQQEEEPDFCRQGCVKEDGEE